MLSGYMLSGYMLSGYMLSGYMLFGYIHFCYLLWFSMIWFGQLCIRLLIFITARTFIKVTNKILHRQGKRKLQTKNKDFGFFQLRFFLISKKGK